MADQALYRKYRSANFSEVIGQEHVTKTLTTAISSGRLSHAYLFTGPRGVGKTSVARLLARALNCTGDTKPCNDCRLCNAAINSSLDIIEIDAASNRSIDAVRELRDKVGLAPAIGKYKVYIIDEVHMLTTEAFNALLKTLEEPPSHAVFVLATTESHKVPETIISRTQRFNFRPITNTDIVKHLTQIAKSEDIKIESDALQVIAVAARGGFRDAIGMLDQMATSDGKKITAGNVRSLLGLSDNEAIGAISSAIVAHDAKQAIEALTALIDQGAQPGQIAVQLAAQWREALLVNVGAASSTNEATQQLAAALAPAQIGRAIELLLEVTRSPWPREALEVGVVRLAAGEATASAVQPVTAAPSRTSQTAPRPSSTANTPAAASAPAASDSPNSSELWPKVLVMLRQFHAPLAAAIYRYPVEISGDIITIKSPYNYHRDLVMKAQNRKTIEDVAIKVFGRQVTVTSVTDDSAQKVMKSAGADPNAELVSSALEILGGEVVE